MLFFSTASIEVEVMLNEVYLEYRDTIIKHLKNISFKFKMFFKKIL